MTQRAMGKLVDWDFEKYRGMRKIVDRGNKRRLLRNITRFMKNPLGYIYWSMNARKVTFQTTYALVWLSLIAAVFHYIGL